MKERVKQENRRFFSTKEKKIMLEKSNGRCAHCGSPISLSEDFTVEHVIPLSKGGTNNISNLVALCKKCNKEKSNYIYLPSDYYKYVKREYLEELMRNHDLYCKETNYITVTNAFREDSFYVKGFPTLKKGLITTNGIRISKPKGCAISREVKRVVYSDLDQVYNFYKRYYAHYGVDISDEALKEVLTHGFEDSVYYILKGRKEGDILLVLKICFLGFKEGYAIWLDLAVDYQTVSLKYEDVVDDMFNNILYSLVGRLGGNEPMSFAMFMSCIKGDKIAYDLIADQCGEFDFFEDRLASLKNFMILEGYADKYVLGEIAIGNTANKNIVRDNEDSIIFKDDNDTYCVSNDGAFGESRLRGLNFIEKCIKNSKYAR